LKEEALDALCEEVALERGHGAVVRQTPESFSKYGV